MRKIEGPGTYTFKNGDFYSGMWSKSKRHGRGCQTLVKRLNVYEGEWILDNRNGIGSELYPNGDLYHG
jgi:hypothetical protein